MSKKWELFRYNLGVLGTNESLIVSGILGGLLTAGGVTAFSLGARKNNGSMVLMILGWILMLAAVASLTWFGASVFRRVRSKQQN
jgi:hypothetical protein